MVKVGVDLNQLNVEHGMDLCRRVWVNKFGFQAKSSADSFFLVVSIHTGHALWRG